jgi:hypothetical protein
LHVLYTLYITLKQAGVWGSLPRTAFDCHLQGNARCALLAYAEAAELGYTVATGNATYVLDKYSAALAQLWGVGQEVYSALSSSVLCMLLHWIVLLLVSALVLVLHDVAALSVQRTIGFILSLHFAFNSTANTSCVAGSV